MAATYAKNDPAQTNPTHCAQTSMAATYARIAHSFWKHPLTEITAWRPIGLGKQIPDIENNACNKTCKFHQESFGSAAAVPTATTTPSPTAPCNCWNCVGTAAAVLKATNRKQKQSNQHYHIAFRSMAAVSAATLAEATKKQQTNQQAPKRHQKLR